MEILLTKKRALILLAVIVVLIVTSYFYLNSGDFACCLVKENRQRLCVDREYMIERLNMTTKSWSKSSNCTSRTVYCKKNETDDVVCRIPKEWWVI